MKKLPNIYRGEVKSNNNIKVSHTTNEEKKLNPKQIINDLFKRNHIYKQEVYIETNDKKINTKIIGRTDSHIITINNDVIKIDEIIDIKIKTS